MPSYQNWSIQQLDAEISRLEPQLQAYITQKLKLNMTRGKPCAEQLKLSSGLMSCLSPDDYLSEDGTDCRNYGGLDGLIETRRLFADLLDTRPDQVMVIGNSSLNLMYDMMVRCLLFPLPGSDKAWSRMDKVRFICPVPGYDRHFFVTQSLGIEMIPVPMTPQGPDMDLIESLVAADATIKGMWLVPVYSNPDGITCSAETCRRLAAMKTAADDFRIFWDNAYVVHHLNPESPEKTPEILSLCEKIGNPDRVFEFSSSSKITWAGAGIACIASSLNNLAYIRKHMTAQSIGPDKMNQLRHARFLKDLDTVHALMRSHAEIMRPKFDLVERYLAQELAETGFCHWNKPGGGYFVSLFVLPGTASEVVRLARSCGVELT
ncbi:MAG: aminotransferase class I/II-fold pyridoxal phosphate-dependent enzyme, partial [Bacillota bacterium]|nr:aminotransferase class I/II-fold pyridoxal phosphate-dependent enzyme [Bacillota bacterium]